MKKSLLALSATILIALLLAATSCLPTAVNIVVTEDGNLVVTEDAMEQAVATYGGRLSGKITVNSGDLFTVTLYAHLGAGLRWSANMENASIGYPVLIQLFSDDPPGIVGGPGREVWTFKAQDEGVDTFTMTYNSLGPFLVMYSSDETEANDEQNVNTLELIVVVDGG